MRAYLGYVDRSGLRRFVPEDALPGDVLRELALSWTSRTTSVCWAVLTDEDAEAIHRELWAGRPAAACDLLSVRSVEVIPVAYASHEPDRTPDPRPAY